MYARAQVHSKLSAWLSIDHVNSITAAPSPISGISVIYIQFQVSGSFALYECANIYTITSLIMSFPFISIHNHDIFMFSTSYFFIYFHTLPLLLLFNPPASYLNSS